VGVKFDMTYSDLGYRKKLAWRDEGCRLLDIPFAVEDLAPLEDGLVFGGGADLEQTFLHGSATARNGALFLIDPAKGKWQQITVDNWESDPPPKFTPHGMHFSPLTRRLHVVNHDEARGESVEIFSVPLDIASSLSVVHESSVRSSLWQNLALNDVVEGLDSEFFVTEWLAFGYPKGGLHSTTQTWGDKLGHLGHVLSTLFKVPMTRVFRCSNKEPASSPNSLTSHSKARTPGWICHTASWIRFVGANGITASADRKRFYVNDPPSVMMTVLHRQQAPSGEVDLVYNGSFSTGTRLDNVEMRPDGAIEGGSIPIAHASFTVCDAGLGGSREISGRRVGCGHSPGGFHRLHPRLLPDGRWTSHETDLIMHDGSLLSGVSAGLQVKGKVLLGSPEGKGVLLCDAKDAAKSKA